MQTSFQKTGKAVISLLLAVAIIFSLFAVGTISAFAATSTGVGLSAYCLNAYYEQWDYVWGGVTPGAVDCSGLIYSYNGVGGVRTDMLSSSNEWGYVSNGIPRIHGLGLHMPGHVGVYVGNGLEVDARSSYYDMCYGSVYDLNWVEWFKIYGVSYPTTGWVLYNGDSYYYENGQYVVNTSRTLNGVKYTFGSDGVSDKNPPSSEYDQTDYSGSASTGNSNPSSKGDGILRLGSEGDDVEKLQEALAEAGYYDEEVTGYFGQYTEKMVKQFQKDMGLLSDGEVGPYTWAALESYEKPTEKATEKPTEKPTAKPTEEATEAPTDEPDDEAPTYDEESEDTNYNEPVTDPATEEKTEAPTEAPTEPPKVDKLAMGGEGTKVSQLQSRLAELRYYMGDINGVFDQSTYDAMQDYFKTSELEPVDEMTDEQFALLLSEAAVKSSAYTELQLGYKGTDVTALQKLLIKLGFMDGEASGIFDEKTKDAVMSAQTNFDFEVNGIADQSFIDALEAQMAVVMAVEETEPITDAPTEAESEAPTQEQTEAPTDAETKPETQPATTGTEPGSAVSATAISNSGTGSSSSSTSSTTGTQGKGVANTGSATTFIWVAALLFFISALSLAVFTTQSGKKDIGRYYRK